MTFGSKTSVEHTAKDLLDEAEHHNIFHKLGSKIDAIVRGIESQRARDPVTERLVFGATPYKLKRQGYRHVFVYVNANATLTVENGIGSASVTLTGPGWTQVDWTNEAEITAAAQTNAILELRDWL